MSKKDWGSREDDLIVERCIPKLVRMLSLCEDVLEDHSNIRDTELSIFLNLIEVQDALIDALYSCRAYEKERCDSVSDSQKEEDERIVMESIGLKKRGMEDGK